MPGWINLKFLMLFWLVVRRVCQRFRRLYPGFLVRSRGKTSILMKRGIDHLLCLHTIEARQKYALTKEQWASIKAETLVLWTSHDPTASVEVGKHLAGLIPGSKLVVMQDCGHWPQFEDAATFNRIHVEFLRTGGVSA